MKHTLEHWAGVCLLQASLLGTYWRKKASRMLLSEEWTILLLALSLSLGSALLLVIYYELFHALLTRST
jgi:hypothetical protein